MLLTAESQSINRQEAEIEKVEWHNIDEILKSDDISEHNKNFIKEGLKRMWDDNASPNLHPLCLCWRYFFEIAVKKGTVSKKGIASNKA